MRGYVTAAIAAIGLFAAAPAAAQDRYSNLFVFGDSLVDSGNARIARLSQGGQDPAPPALGYFEGRFSNGYNFADYVSLDLFGDPATAFLAGGTNFSVGGAQASERAGDASPSFAEQIATFTASGLTFSPDSVVLVTLGGNDVRFQLGQAAMGQAPTLAPAIDALESGLSSLLGLGARTIIVTGLPDIGQIPVVTRLNNPALSALGTRLSFDLNEAFRGSVSDLSGGMAGANLRFFDLFAYQRAIYADPTAYGLPATLNTRDACLLVPGAAPGCDGFVYFDTIHPTTQVHRAIADGLVAQAVAVPEPATWGLLIVGVGAVGGALRRRRYAARMAFAA